MHFVDFSRIYGSVKLYYFIFLILESQTRLNVLPKPHEAKQLIFNRVPKCGSTTLTMKILENSGILGNFHLKKNDYFKNIYKGVKYHPGYVYEIEAFGEIYT